MVILAAAGFTEFVEQDQSKHLLAMVNAIKMKIDLARFAVGYVLIGARKSA
ncbi:MAG TPA: hypothetical protein VIR57_19280 [Chloroflexota bacterium]|jgi:hypothetical protein